MNTHIRNRLLQAVSELCDRELQERLWVHGQRNTEDELGFDDTLLVLIDELEAGRPEELVGHVLKDTYELDAFLRLSNSIETLSVVIGERGTYEDAVGSGAPWLEVVAAARKCQALVAE